MSAFIVSQEHVLTIAKAYNKFIVQSNSSFTIEPELSELVEIAKILYKENVKSVNYRYNTRSRLPNLENHTPIQVNNTELIKLIQCLDYQSCEHKDYTKSKAKKMIDELLIAVYYAILIKNNKDYDAAKWTV